MSMNVSLEQAIEIHARALLKRLGRKRGAERAHDEAQRLRDAGDHEGHVVWSRVREKIETLLHPTEADGVTKGGGTTFH